MLEGSELLELLALFQGGGGEPDEFAENVPAVAVDAEMEERHDGALLVARVTVEGDPAAREIEGVAGDSRHHLHAVRVVGFLRLGKGRGGGDHRDLRIADQGRREILDQHRIDQRLVSLNIDEVGDAPQARRDLSDPVGAARMGGGGHHHFRSEVEGRLGNPVVIRGDDDLGDFFREQCALPDMADKGFAGDHVEALSGKAR